MDGYRENWDSVLDYAYRIPELKWKHVFIITIYFSFESISNWITFYKKKNLTDKNFQIKLDAMEDMKQSKLWILSLKS